MIGRWRCYSEISLPALLATCGEWVFGNIFAAWSLMWKRTSWLKFNVFLQYILSTSSVVNKCSARRYFKT